MKETEGIEEFPSGTEDEEPEGSEEETEGFGTLAEGLEAGDSEESFGPERAELGTDCGSCRKEVIWPADQSIDGL
jgi:hypothetical protein